jgi:hypothetical protein
MKLMKVKYFGCSLGVEKEKRKPRQQCFNKRRFETTLLLKVSESRNSSQNAYFRKWDLQRFYDFCLGFVAQKL